MKNEDVGKKRQQLTAAKKYDNKHRIKAELSTLNAFPSALKARNTKKNSSKLLTGNFASFKASKITTTKTRENTLL